MPGGGQGDKPRPVVERAGRRAARRAARQRRDARHGLGRRRAGTRRRKRAAVCRRRRHCDAGGGGAAGRAAKVGADEGRVVALIFNYATKRCA